MSSRFHSLVATAFAFVLAAAAVRTQERLEVLGPEPATVRLGDAARAELRIVDPAGSLRDIVVPEVPGLRLSLQGPTQQTEQRLVGQRLERKYTVAYSLELLPAREGTFVVPPFPVWTGTREQMTRELRIEVKKDLLGEELGWLDVQVEPQRVYVHEPIRVRIDCGVQQRLRLVQGRASNGQPYFDVDMFLYLYPFYIHCPLGTATHQ